MAIEIDQLIKIILGALVVVVVGVAIFFFFKFGAIDFFKNLMGGEEAEKEIQPSKPEPSKSILEICREKIEKGEYKSQEECLKEEKSYQIDNIGFKIGDNNPEFNKDVSKPRGYDIELIVISEENCERVEYRIILNKKLFSTWRFWENGFWGIDEEISYEVNLDEVNVVLNKLPVGVYYVVGFCFDKKGKAKLINSKNLEVK